MGSRKVGISASIGFSKIMREKNAKRGKIYLVEYKKNY